MGRMQMNDDGGVCVENALAGVAPAYGCCTIY